MDRAVVKVASGSKDRGGAGRAVWVARGGLEARAEEDIINSAGVGDAGVCGLGVGVCSGAVRGLDRLESAVPEERLVFTVCGVAPVSGTVVRSADSVHVPCNYCILLGLVCCNLGTSAVRIHGFAYGGVFWQVYPQDVEGSALVLVDGAVAEVALQWVGDGLHVDGASLGEAIGE